MKASLQIKLFWKTQWPRGKEAHRELPDYRYRLKAPVFTGNENMEQFIQEFSDVVAVTQ